MIIVIIFLTGIASFIMGYRFCNWYNSRFNPYIYENDEEDFETEDFFNLHWKGTIILGTCKHCNIQDKKLQLMSYSALTSAI